MEGSVFIVNGKSNVLANVLSIAVNPGEDDFGLIPSPAVDTSLTQHVVGGNAVENRLDGVEDAIEVRGVRRVQVGCGALYPNGHRAISESAITGLPNRR
jgi:hypothetical protein